MILVGGRWLMSVCTDGSDRCTAGLGVAALTHRGLIIYDCFGFIFAIVNVPKDVN